MGRVPARSLESFDVWGSDSAPEFYDVGGDNVLRIAAVFSAVGLIADSVAALPLQFYRREGDTRRRIADPVWAQQPDDRLSTYDWMHQAMVSLLLRGNAYGRVFRDRFGRVSEVEWQHPSKVSIDESKWAPRYLIGGKPFGGIRQGGDILHLPAFVMPGSVVGKSPVTLFRHQFETSRSAQQTARDFYADRAIPSGLLTSSAPLTGEAATTAKARWKESVRPGDVAVMDGTRWTWEQVTLSAADMAFLDAIQAGATEIAAIYRVEPEDIGGKASGSLRYSTVEGNQRKFNLRTLTPWTTRIEQAIAPLLGPGEFAKFNLDALARPDLLARSQATSEQLRNGTLTLAEARALEDRAPLTEAELASWRQDFLHLTPPTAITPAKEGS